MIRDALSYLYVNAKVMAKEGKFISASRWEDLWGCTSPAEVASILEGTDYFSYLSEGAMNETKELESAILEEYSQTAREISAILPKRAEPIKDYVLKKWDVLNLRKAIRTVHCGFRKEEVLDGFIEGSDIGFSFFKTLIESETMDDLVGLLEGTPYYSLSEALANYNESGNLFFLESLVDKIFWTDLWQKVLNLKGLNEFKDFIARYVEAYNLKIILRAKNDELPLEAINPYLIHGCTLLNEILPNFDEESLPGLIPFLEDSVYFEPFISVQQDYEKTGSIFCFERVLDDLIMSKAEGVRKKKPFGVGPLIAFLESKASEINNLLAVIRSTELNLNRDELRDKVTRREWK